MTAPSTERPYDELRIRLVGYPTKLSLRAEEHVSEWTREFKLIAFASGGEAEPAEQPPRHRAPARLVELAEQLRTVFATEVSEAERKRARAYAEGRATLDVEFPTLPETAELVVAWRDVVNQVDQFCRDDELLTLERPPEVVAFGDWVFDEFIRQMRGEDPQPWTGPLE